MDPEDPILRFRVFETLISDVARPCLIFPPVVCKAERLLGDCVLVKARGLDGRGKIGESSISELVELLRSCDIHSNGFCCSCDCI